MKGATCNDVDVCGRISDFNPRTREGCDLCKRCGFFNNSNFNPRTREGCDLTTVNRFDARFDISIHAPVKGATPSTTDPPTPACNFNPRTRAGCDPGEAAGAGRPVISIHAPVLGATRWKLAVSALYFGFQSTHPCWVRPLHERRRFIQRNIFQSTHPCWVRLTTINRFDARFDISIHAPVLGATLPSGISRMTSSYFNPRTRAGCDLPCLYCLFHQ